jgi:hypothetical protein
MPALGSGALARAGGNTTEATTTSTTAVDLLTIASLSITEATPFYFKFAGRKSAGAAASASAGLKINTTVTQEASTSGIWDAGTANEAKSGTSFNTVSARVANYLRTGANVFATSPGSRSNIANVSETAAFPAATITDIVLRGISGDAAVTLGLDEAHVYTESVS